MILLSDLFLANSSEPWQIPDADLLPPIDPAFAEPARRGRSSRTRAIAAAAARPWAIPGTPGLTHRIGGLEKQDVTGDISYDGVEPRADDRAPRRARSRRIAAELPPLEVDEDPRRRAAGARLGLEPGRDPRGRAARARQRPRVAIAHLHHLQPLPPNLGEVLRRYERVLVPEMNTGQLAQLLRAEFLVDVESYTKLEGKPLFAAELEREIEARL